MEIKKMRLGFKYLIYWAYYMNLILISINKSIFIISKNLSFSGNRLVFVF